MSNIKVTEIVKEMEKEWYENSILNFPQTYERYQVKDSSNYTNLTQDLKKIK